MVFIIGCGRKYGGCGEVSIILKCFGHQWLSVVRTIEVSASRRLVFYYARTNWCFLFCPFARCCPLLNGLLRQVPLYLNSLQCRKVICKCQGSHPSCKRLGHAHRLSLSHFTLDSQTICACMQTQSTIPFAVTSLISL